MPPRYASALIAAALAVAAAAGCGGDPAATAKDAGEPTVAELPASTSAPHADPTFTLNAPRDAHPVVWVRNGHRAELSTRPGAGELVDRVGSRTEFDSRTVFGVVREAGGWAAVTTPTLPNGELAWVKLDPDRLKAGWTRASIVIDLSERRVALLDGERTKRSFAVTVGMPGAETPLGRFSVTDKFRDGLNPVYGCCALALSATQPHLPSGWLGGSRIAIHGTSGPLGIAASHGCVRAADAEVANLVDRVPLGTPVFIRA